MTPKAYVREFPIRIHDVDAAGIVFFANYFVLMHDVYEAFLADIGHPISGAINAGDVIIPVVESHCRYRKPIRHGEIITGMLSIAEIRQTSYTVFCRFLGKEGDLRAELTVRHVCVDQGTMRPVPLSDAFRAALDPYVT